MPEKRKVEIIIEVFCHGSNPCSELFITKRSQFKYFKQFEKITKLKELQQKYEWTRIGLKWKCNLSKESDIFELVLSLNDEFYGAIRRKCICTDELFQTLLLDNSLFSSSSVNRNNITYTIAQIEHFKSTYAMSSKRSFIAGLSNVGNSCYLSTAIKCLVSCLPFILQLIREHSGNESNYITQLSNLICKLLQIKQKEPVPVISPSLFKQALGLQDKTYLGSEQNDCFQTIIALLDLVHIATKPSKNEKMHRFETIQLTEQYNSFLFNAYIDECNREIRKHSSIVYDYFLNTCIIIYECPKCAYRMAKFDITIGMPLEITGFKHLDECVNQYFGFEEFSDYKCKHCANVVKIKIKRCPLMFAPILIFQLKRFRIDYETMTYVKDYTVIKYPTDNEPLTLGKYVYKPYQKGQYNMEYYLIATAIHHGTLIGGHYYANIFNLRKNQWEIHNDSMVHDATGNDFSPDAITLVYMRKDLFRKNGADDKLMNK